jgi:hypothetical protein
MPTVAGKPRQERCNRMARKDRTGQLGQDDKDRTTVKDSQGRTARRGQLGQKNQDRTSMAGQL